jgi:hypothetical protein
VPRGPRAELPLPIARRPKPRSDGGAREDSEAGISATITAVSEAVTTAQRERDRAVEGGIVNAPSQWMPTECGIASAIPDFLCRVPPTAGCPSLAPATWSPEKEESHVHVGRCEEARSQNC